METIIIELSCILCSEDVQEQWKLLNSVEGEMDRWKER